MYYGSDDPWKALKDDLAFAEQLVASYGGSAHEREKLSGLLVIARDTERQLRQAGTPGALELAERYSSLQSKINSTLF